MPVSELYINSPVASEILGRTALTGWSGHVRCGIMNQMLIEGRAEEFYHREVEDLVELYTRLELDTILIERPPLAVPQIPVAIDETTWKFEDRESGLWNVVHYDPKTDLFHTADSNFHHGGLEEFARYVELLEKDEVNLDNWSFKQAEYIMDKCGKDKFVMAVVEIDFKDEMLEHPMVNEDYIYAMGWASEEQVKLIKQYSRRINELLCAVMRQVEIEVIDCKLEFGVTVDGTLVLADEISPDTCRLWDASTHEKLGIDRFRRNLGDVEQAYQEVWSRLMGERA